jgi:hypothetical protein
MSLLQSMSIYRIDDRFQQITKGLGDSLQFIIEWRFEQVAGPARTLGNLGRLAPRLIDSYIGLRGASWSNSRRTNRGEDSARLFGRDRLLL